MRVCACSWLQPTRRGYVLSTVLSNATAATSCFLFTLPMAFFGMASTCKQAPTHQCMSDRRVATRLRTWARTKHHRRGTFSRARWSLHHSSIASRAAPPLPPSPPRNTTTAPTVWPHFSSSTPTTAASATDGWLSSTRSTSNALSWVPRRSHGSQITPHVQQGRPAATRHTHLVAAALDDVARGAPENGVAVVVRRPGSHVARTEEPLPARPNHTRDAMNTVEGEPVPHSRRHRMPRLWLRAGLHTL